MSLPSDPLADEGALLQSERADRPVEIHLMCRFSCSYRVSKGHEGQFRQPRWMAGIGFESGLLPLITTEPTKAGSQSSAAQRFPIDATLESGGGAVDRFLGENPADQHQPNRQPVNQTTRQAHRRVVGSIELSGVGQHLKA